MRGLFRTWLILLCAFALSPVARAQIDPEKRRLFQLGYNQPLEGRNPIGGYGFFYYNQPDFYRTNLTLRMAIAPVYVDSELGFRELLGPDTDLAFGVAGGGFADSYSEIQRGNLIRSESYTGHAGEASLSLYHLFNPEQTIPLNLVFRTIAHYSFYERDQGKTDSAFELPADGTTVTVRGGLRWGGSEPVIFPALAFELSAWAETQVRNNSTAYGFADDRLTEPDSHRFWGRALLAYTVPESAHYFSVNLTLGTSVEADRFSAYRLGGALPLVSEFPLVIPGYYYQEISAKQFVLFGAQYAYSLDAAQRWGLVLHGATAAVDYVPGMEQPGKTHTGVGGGVIYKSADNAWHVMLGYGYGIDAIRHNDRGAHSIGILLQYDLEADLRSTKPFWDNWINPNTWRGFDRLLGR